VIQTDYLYLGVFKNWGQVLLHWNFFLDRKSGPYSGQCYGCGYPITWVENDYIKLTPTEQYYGLAHVSKFLKYPAWRVDCTVSASMSCVDAVCFKNKDGSTISLFKNFCNTTQTASVQNGNAFVEAPLAKGLTTFVW